MEKDDMVFVNYMNQPDSWQCKMNVAAVLISVRLGPRLVTDNERPYEVWYPTEDAPTGYQTANDIWDYISRNKGN